MTALGISICGKEREVGYESYVIDVSVYPVGDLELGQLLQMSQLRQRVWVLFLKDGQEDTGNKNNAIKWAWQGSCFCYCEEGCWPQVTVSLLQFQNKVSLNSLSVTNHTALAMLCTRRSPTGYFYMLMSPEDRP